MPFEQSQNHEVVTLVTKGHRLYRPKMATPAIYDIMQLSWHEVRTGPGKVWKLFPDFCPHSVVCVSEARGASVLRSALPHDLRRSGGRRPAPNLTN